MTHYCEAITQEGKRGRHPIAPKKWADGRRDCGRHKWIKKVDKKLSGQQSLFDDTKNKYDDLTLAAKNEKLEIENEKLRAENEKLRVEAAGKKVKHVDAKLSRFGTKRAERDQEAQTEARKPESEIENRKAYTQEGQNREKQSDEARTEGRLSRARARVRKQPKRLVVGTGKVAKRTARRTRKWVSDTATKENAKRLVKLMAKGAVKAGWEYVKYKLYTRT